MEHFDLPGILCRYRRAYRHIYTYVCVSVCECRACLAPLASTLNGNGSGEHSLSGSGATLFAQRHLPFTTTTLLNPAQCLPQLSSLLPFPIANYARCFWAFSNHLPLSFLASLAKLFRFFFSHRLNTQLERVKVHLI